MRKLLQPYEFVILKYLRKSNADSVTFDLLLVEMRRYDRCKVSVLQEFLRRLEDLKLITTVGYLTKDKIYNITNLGTGALLLTQDFYSKD